MGFPKYKGFINYIGYYTNAHVILNLLMSGVNRSNMRLAKHLLLFETKLIISLICTRSKLLYMNNIKITLKSHCGVKNIKFCHNVHNF